MGLRTIPIVVKLWHRGPRTAVKKFALSANHLPISSSPADRASSSEEYIFVLSVFILIIDTIVRLLVRREIARNILLVHDVLSRQHLTDSTRDEEYETLQEDANKARIAPDSRLRFGIVAAEELL